MNPSTIITVFAFLLITIGLVGYFATDRVSMTALIPTLLGTLLLLCGVVASKGGNRKLGWYGALGLAILGMAGSARGVPGLFRLMSGETVARPAAVIAQGVTAVLCAILVILLIRFIVAARRR